MHDEVLKEVIEIIHQVKDDKSVPKNIISKLNEILDIINEDQPDLYIKIDKILQQLEEISEDSNLQPFIRTRLWNMTSLLESL